MPHRALQPCFYPGCPTLVRRGRCDQHRQAEPQAYRDPKVERLYHTRLWRRMRSAQLAREPWCADCLRANIYEPATDVDHVKPHHGDPDLFFTGKLQSLCHVCHSRKTAKEVFGKVGV
jgi:5-methylcytosine-specific restriction protein A